MAKNPRLIDVSGQSFSDWVVIEKAGNTAGGGALWLCECACGTRRAVLGSDLRNGKSRGCGCTKTERLGDLKRTHGLSGTRLHSIWKNMRGRCGRPGHPQFPHYGGRGIAICSDWHVFQAFHAWAMGSGYSDSLSIERVDVNLGYSPQNCIWANAQTQSENRRFVQRAPDGELWWHKAQKNDITQGAYRTRLHDGWTHEEASSRPVRAIRRK